MVYDNPRYCYATVVTFDVKINVNSSPNFVVQILTNNPYFYFSLINISNVVSMTNIISILFLCHAIYNERAIIQLTILWVILEIVNSAVRIKIVDNEA